MNSLDPKSGATIFPLLASRLARAPANLELKDVVVSLPVVGTAIAISWEIGSFIPIGFGPFGFFSLSEHLLFATQAMPIGLTIAALMPVIITIAGRTKRRHARRSQTSLKIRLAIGFAVLLFLLISAILFYLGIANRSTALVVLAAGTLMLAVAFGLSPAVLILWPKQLYITVAAFALAGAVAVGCDQMRGRLNYARSAPLEFSHLTRVNIEGHDRDVEILRSGERGLLAYERSSDRLFFAKWDFVKDISWARRPLITSTPPK